MWLPGFGWLAMSILTPYLMFVRPNREQLHDISDTIRTDGPEQIPTDNAPVTKKIIQIFN